MVCPHEQGDEGVEPVRTFCGQGERGSGVTDGEKMPPENSDVGPFLEMGPLISAFFTFWTIL